jgi:hypothetical protein
MIKDFLMVVSLLACANIWALDCSAPVTISDPRIDGYGSQICANEQGDAVVMWISKKGSKRAFTSAYKTDKFSWSSPENICGWEKREMGKSKCYINSEGDLFALWGIKNEDTYIIQTNEKKREDAWALPSDWVTYPYPYNLFVIGFDASNQMLFVGKTEAKIKGWFFEKLVHSIDVFVKEPFQTVKDNHVLIKDEEALWIINESLVTHKSGLAYVFWVSRASDKFVLKCQKIKNGELVSSPVTICQLDEYLYDLKGALNENGDVVLGFKSTNGSIGVITKIEDTQNKDRWSSPVILETGQDYCYDIQVAVDDLGNNMIAYTINRDDKFFINTYYKTKEGAWLSSVSFSSPKGPTFNPKLEADGQGNFILLWVEEKRNMESIYGAAFSTTTHEWAHPQRLSPEGDCCFDPSLTFFAPGKGYISWTKISSELDNSIQVAELTN